MMSRHNARALAGLGPSLLLGLLLGACSYLPMVGSRCGVSGPMPFAGETVGGMSFHMPTPADLRTIGARPINGYFLPIQPTIQGAISTARQLDSGNDNFTYAFPAPDSWGKDWIVENVTTTGITPLASGDASAYVNQRLVPIAQRWASDATLDTQYEKMPDLGAMRAGTDMPYDPNRVKDAASILQNVGWPLAYLSSSKRSALLFYRTGLVVHLTWALPEDASDTVPIKRAQAIAIHEAAMRSPDSQSEEERTGNDHFLGTPYQGVFPSPVPFNQHDDLKPSFDFPPGTAWDATFEEDFAGKPYWLVSVPTGAGYGMGMVDAVTGVEIRFIRPNTNYSTSRTAPTPFVPMPAPGGSVPTLPVAISSP
ncbi:MAG TPA: hypothetical protein V6D47_18950 [Oscillatoriaceae cyanobacterium]